MCLSKYFLELKKYLSMSNSINWRTLFMWVILPIFLFFLLVAAVGVVAASVTLASIHSEGNEWQRELDLNKPFVFTMWAGSRTNNESDIERRECVWCVEWRGGGGGGWEWPEFAKHNNECYQRRAHGYIEFTNACAQCGATSEKARERERTCLQAAIRGCIHGVTLPPLICSAGEGGLPVCILIEGPLLLS